MDILKLVLDFIKLSHPEAGVSIGDYSGFVVIPGSRHIQGYTAAAFSGYNWEINIGHAVTPHPVYLIKAVRDGGKAIWNGQIVEGKVEETSYEENIR